jgi:hypothetical protein
MATIEIRDVGEIEILRAALQSGVSNAIDSIRTILEFETDTSQILQLLHFPETPPTAIDFQRLSLIDQVARTSAFLAVLAAARWLMERHPESNGLTMRTEC